MPVLNHGTFLRKTDFRDALCIRYDLPLPDVATACVCGSAMSVRHAMHPEQIYCIIEDWPDCEDTYTREHKVLK